MSKRLNLVQVNFAQGPKELNAFYLPYSAGVLWAHAQTVVGDAWHLGSLAWRRDSIDGIHRQLADCDLIGFSSYIWNRNYSYALARAIKAHNPRCTVVFGGPEPAVADPDFFRDHPYVDAVVKKEGEIAFSQLLARGMDHGIKGLVINDRGHPLDTGDGVRIDRLDQLPSPYTTGVFDQIISDNPGVTWNATLETNRGCPYQCTFCDWGSLTYNKVKQFDLARVFADMEWIGRNRCDWMSITDANFGMFMPRDEAIVDQLLAVQDRYGYPRRMGVSWAKNQRAEVAKLSRKLMTRGFNNGLTLSVQSMDDRVLGAIKRRNLAVHRLGEMFDICAREGMTVNTELILGLPEETLASWQHSVWQLLELGQHSGIEFFQAQLLENAEMNLTQKQQYQLTSMLVHDYLSGADQDDAWPEGVRVVTSTRDMSLEHMLQAQEFAWFINTWHINGISQWYSRYLRRRHGIAYSEFYTGLQRYLLAHDWWQAERTSVMAAYRAWMTDGRVEVEPIAGVKIHGWNLIHVTNLRMHALSTYGRYLNAVAAYTEDSYGHLFADAHDRCAAKDLRKISDAWLIRHDRLGHYPISTVPDSNVIDVVLCGEDLGQNLLPYLFSFPEDSSQSLSLFLQNIYYARRRNFGKARISRAAIDRDVALTV